MDVKTILIVEDDSNLSKALQIKLIKEGYNVMVAKDGEEGLALALEIHPALILLDIIMPKMDGMTMATRLREDMWGKTVPLIMLTNVSPENSEQLAKLIANEPLYYLIKADTPLSVVVEKVRELL